MSLGFDEINVQVYFTVSYVHEMSIRYIMESQIIDCLTICMQLHFIVTIWEKSLQNRSVNKNRKFNLWMPCYVQDMLKTG